MLKKCLSVCLFGALPMVLGFEGVMAGFPNAASDLQALLRHLPVSESAQGLLYALVGPLGIIFLMLGCLFLFRSADVINHHDGTVTLGVNNRMPADEIKVRRIIPGLASVEVRGVRLFSFAPDRVSEEERNV